MIVVVAEKPSVARDIARVLGCKNRGEGYLSGAAHTVTWALGHLVALCEPDELDERYKKWRAADLPILPERIPTKVIAKTKKQFSTVKKLLLAPDTERVICATDAGREGELIFRLIYEQAGCRKPVDRLWISSMTDEAIREGFAALRPAADYDGLYKSAACRAQADWLVGMNASRAYTLKYDVLLSIGRVQTPTLALLVRRHQEIAAFTPEEYHTLTADFGDYSGLYFDPKLEKNDTRLPTRERAEEIAKAVRGQPARVERAESTPKQEPPPQLYDLTSLQRDANRLLGFTAQKTLKLAQSLYEQWKAITYPRTDSRYLPLDMLGRTRKTLDNLPPPYQALAAGIPYTAEGKLPFSRRIFDNAKVSDHHALIPTPKPPAPDKLPPDERALFDLIARRLIAAFYPAYRYDALTVVTVCQGHAFRSAGRIVREMGWKAVLPAGNAKKGESQEPPLPALAAGDPRTVRKASVKKETTKPPAPHTDASLLAAMEHAGRELEDEALREQMKGSGLGTPATRAAIIERLLAVGYAQRRGRAITATEKGVRLIGIVPPEIASPEMTGKWELALHEIAQNERDTARFMQGIRRLAAFLVEDAAAGARKIEFPEEERARTRGGKHRASPVKPLEDAACPLCGGAVQETAKAFGCAAWKSGCPFTLWKDCLKRAGGPALTARIVKQLLGQGRVAGSTGVVALADGFLTFTPNGAAAPAARVAVAYRRRENAGK